ncbi:MAG: hypothetical protein PHR16_09165 [Methylovulum sp.]|nr:hypothetical protein [Methylovulum sp.]
MMAYEEMSMKNLLELHNKLCPDNPANPKTFATKDKLIARIEHINATSIILVDSSIDGEFRILGHKKKTEATEEHIEQRLEVVEDELAAPETPKKAVKKAKKSKPLAEPKLKGPTIKSVAEKLILDPAGYPYKAIVEMVKAEIECNTTIGCVSWYANKLRKAGIEVPERTKPIKPTE